MNIFSRSWFRYQSIIHSSLYKKVAKERCEGVDFKNHDLFKNFNQDFIFIHIPKSAGLSVISALSNKTNSHHATALDYKKQNEELFNRCYKFTLTREPLARCLSAYYYLKDGGRHNVYDYFWREQYIKKYKTFDSFILDGGLEKAIQGNAEHFIPQWRYVSENNKKILDFIGKLEEIKDFIDIVSSNLGKEINLKKINSSNYSTQNNFSKRVVNKIRDLYKDDYEQLGY